MQAAAEHQEIIGREAMEALAAAEEAEQELVEQILLKDIQQVHQTLAAAVVEIIQQAHRMEEVLE
jgi:hypothetical protein